VDVLDDLEEMEMKRFSKFVSVHTTLTIACLLMTVAAGAQSRTDAEPDPRLIPVFHANEV
jgi:hypothetical protein